MGDIITPNFKNKREAEKKALKGLKTICQSPLESLAGEPIVEVFAKPECALWDAVERTQSLQRITAYNIIMTTTEIMTIWARLLVSR